MPRGTPAKTIIYKGEEKTHAEWADVVGVDRATISVRYARHTQGLIPLDDVFAPRVPDTEKSKGLVAGNRKPSTVGIRPRLTQRLLESFEQNVLPHIDKEMKQYAKTGEHGNCLKFFKDFATYFPKGENEMLDGVAGIAQQAQTIVIFTGTPDKSFDISNYKVIER